MNTPVLFIVFNKPETTRRVLEQIALAKPKRLYIAADGPRSEKDRHACEAARLTATNVTWDCEVKTLFRDNNVGCQQGPKQAIDWFFLHESEGIVLEDDCLPSPSFFPYCEALLEKYRDDERVGAITGTGYLPHGATANSYYFSRYPIPWGWASWARAWARYDLNLTQWPELRDSAFLLKAGGGSPAFESYWKKIFDRCFADEFSHAWDYQWFYSSWVAGFATCAPAVNLVSNIGFGSGATHHDSFDLNIHSRRAEEMSFPLRHPEVVGISSALDKAVDAKLFRTRHYFLKSLFENRLPFGRQVWSLGKSARDLARRL
jgi:hypothetical protein